MDSSSAIKTRVNTNVSKIKLFIQVANNPLRYKLSKKGKNGKDGWNTIDTINVYENNVDGTIQFFVYRASNPRRYCLSKEKITDNEWEYYYDFFCHEYNIDKRISMYKNPKIITHIDCYNHILDTFNTNNIKFVIIRGFKYLPLKPDTDLDIVIHPESYNKFIQIYSSLKDNNLIRIQKPTKYIENDKAVFYTPLFTARHLKEGYHLPGNYYRFDTYSDVFFYKDGEGKGKNAISAINYLKNTYLTI